MITALLIAAVAAIVAGPEGLAAARRQLEALRGRVTIRQALAAGLLLAAAVSWFAGSRPAAPAPGPDPAPAGFTLDGLFRGPTASEDAATIGAICAELADELEHDGRQPEPFLKTAVAFDELRQRARDLRCRGVSIGSRQPAARDAIAAHMEQALGVAGGPVTAEQRAKWVAVLREVGRAATDAAH